MIPAEMGDDDEGGLSVSGTPRKKPRIASMPPADAPMPTIGNWSWSITAF